VNDEAARQSRPASNRSSSRLRVAHSGNAVDLRPKVKLRHAVVTVRPRHLYAAVELDVWPSRLNDRGQKAVKDAFARAIDFLPLTAQRLTVFSHGQSGGYCHTIDRRVAGVLADDLETIAGDLRNLKRGRAAA
jgi:hypothetical protein